MLLVGEQARAERLKALLGDVAGELPRCQLADDVAGARARLQVDTFDAVLVDQAGEQAAGCVRELRETAPDTAIVVLTDDAAIGASVIEAGAQDYLLRDRADGEDLMRTLRFAGEHGSVHAQLALTSQRLHSNERLVASVFEAQEEERRRVARELHDAFGQTLTALTVHLRSLENNVQDAPREKLAERVNQLRGLAAQLVKETSHIARALRPPALDHAGLGPALSQLAEDIHGAVAMPVDCDEVDEALTMAEMGDQAQIALYRIAQEALNNAVKHAGATQAGVSLRRLTDMVELRVWDDGRGFIPENSNGHSHGLTSMRERAAMLGGVALIESTPGQGTAITVTVPVGRRS